MAVSLQVRAAPNVAENDFSIEEALVPVNITNPLGHVQLTNFGGAAGFFNIFGPVSGTYTFVLINPDPNYTGVYTLKGLVGDTGVQCKGPSMFPCTGPGGVSPSFGILIGTASTLNWTFLFL